MPMPGKAPESGAIDFEKFWTWLSAHANCILRAGTPEVLLIDHDDFHWHMAREDENTYVVQLVRGKELVGEIVVMPQEIAYVMPVDTQNDDVVFELLVETEVSREVAYHFVMAHGYDEAEVSGGRRWTH